GRPQIGRELCHVLAGREQLRHPDTVRSGPRQGSSQSGHEVAASFARAKHDPAQKGSTGDALRLHQSGHERSLRQRRFARSARPGDQQERVTGASLDSQLFSGFGYRTVTSEKDGGVLELVGREPTEWRARPNRGAAKAGLTGNASLDQLAQRLLEPPGELLQRVVFVIGGKKDAAIGEE